ncbi:hypothetical protein [Okeania sp. SIO2G5]|uniref:hypothetical protein n=1 Tax=Okeania sp. SIO2G5 TaxID=2607796 RepID=UPI00257E8FB5|nr:hypothetical protein [Okeania sp. SIO2G5]
MASKRKKRTFDGMGYREVQRSNSTRRGRLSKTQRQWLNSNHYKNVGWDSVIALYQKINDLIANNTEDGETLESLFLKAERIGNKYQTQEEQKTFQRQLSQVTEAVAETIEQQFPSAETEYIDFSS